MKDYEGSNICRDYNNDVQEVVYGVFNVDSIYN